MENKGKMRPLVDAEDRLSEGEIRDAVIKWGCDEGLGALAVMEEVCAGGRRLDVVMASPTEKRGKWYGYDIVGIEVKSDFDTLERLRHQVVAYEGVCDYTIVACGEAHVKKILEMEMVSGSVGVVVVKRNRDGDIVVRVVRRWGRRVFREYRLLVRELTMANLREFLKEYRDGGMRGAWGRRHGELVDLACGLVGCPAAFEFVKFLWVQQKRDQWWKK